MKYEINQWLYKSLQELDLLRLHEFQNRLSSACLLREVLDQKAWQVIASMSVTELGVLDAELNGITRYVPFDMALFAGSIELLSRNRAEYFKGGWEEKVSQLLFLPHKQYVDVEEVCQESFYFSKKIRALEWIQDNIGTLPKIKGLWELCVKASGILYAKKRSSFLSSGEQRKNMLSELERVRGIMGDFPLELGDISAYSAREIADIPYQNYDKVKIRLPKMCFGQGFCNAIFLELLKHCDIERIELENKELLVDNEFIEDMLERMDFDDEAQQKTYELFRHFGATDKLYKVINEKQMNIAEYKFLYMKYFEEDRDEPMVIDVMKAKDKEDEV